METHRAARLQGLTGSSATYRGPGSLALRAVDSELLLLHRKVTSVGLATKMDCKILELT